MPVELSRHAAEQFRALIVTRSLPDGTTRRAQRILQRLEHFPELGRELSGRWAGHRVVLGPWRWMLFVYRIDAEHDRVVVVTVQDARSSTAITNP